MILRSEPTPEPFRCSGAARERGDWLHATASRVRAWLLVEQPGPWGTDAVLQSRLPHRVAAELVRRCAELRIRVLLIRRPGRTQAADRTVAAAWTSARSWWLAEGNVNDPADLLDASLEPLADGRMPSFVRPSQEPMFLVCTNGRRDVCCAERGRRLVRALAASPDHGGRAWECSHIGGDRFAANLLCFPHGVYYGWVEPPEGIHLAEAYREGRLELDRYRGRAGLPVAVQAAEQFLRERLDLTGLDDLRLRSRRRVQDGDVRVTFDRPDGERASAVVRILHDGTGFRLTCQSAEPAAPPRFEILASV